MAAATAPHTRTLALRLTEGVPDEALFAIDPLGHILTWGPGARGILGYEAEEVVGRHISLLYPPEELGIGAPARDLRAAELAGRLERESWRVRKGGERFWGYVLTTALRDGTGSLLGFVRLTRDLTDSLVAEEALRISEATSSGIISGALDAIISTDAACRITRFNRAAETIFGCAAEEMLGRPAEILFPDRLRGLARRCVETLGRLSASSRRLRGREVVGLRRGGEEFPAEASLLKIEVRGETLYTLILRDITARREDERRIAELLRREQEQRAQAELSERRSRLLAEAGELLARHAWSPSVLRNIGRLAVPGMADFLAVDLVQGDSVRRAAQASSRPAAVELPDLFRPLRGSHAERAMRTGAALIISGAGSDPGDAAAEDRAGALPEVRSFIRAPVRAGEERLGILSMGTVTNGRELGQEDVRMAEDLARHIGLALTRGRLYREAEVARREAERAAERTQRLQTITAALSEARTTREIVGAILHHGTEHLGGSGGAVALLAAEGDHVVVEGCVGLSPDLASRGSPIPLDAESPLAEAVRRRRLVVVGSKDVFLSRYPSLAQLAENTEIQSLCVLPLILEGRVLGVLAITFGRRVRIGRDERGFLDTLGQQCASALERARLYESEVAAHRLADQAVRAREELLGIVSHDLGNLLGAVLINARALLDLPLSPATAEVVRPRAESIMRLARRMKRLRRDLLDANALSDGRLSLRMAPHSVRLLLDVAYEQFVPLAAEGSLELQKHCDGVLPAVLCDGERVLQVMGNLVENALKFTPPGGRIELAAAGSDDRVRFTVRDTGRGIPPEEMPHLFEQAPSPRDGGGTGRGLSIVRALVEAQGGEIWAESELGRGSSFHFTIPGVPVAGSGVVNPP
jgi:PAS domain S-box-containing protein